MPPQETTRPIPHGSSSAESGGLSPRERVLAALDHREPDRVPLDLGSTGVTGIHVRACAKLRTILGLPESIVQIDDLPQQLGHIDDDLADTLRVDVRGVSVGSLPSVVETKDDFRYRDEFGIGWRMPKGTGLYFDMFDHPLAGEIGQSDLEEFLWPGIPTRDELAPMCEAVRRIREVEARAVMVSSICWGPMETAAGIRGYEDLYADVALDRARIGHILDRVLERKLTYWERVFDLLGDAVDVVKEADDFAGQTGLLISPDAYRTLIKPRQRDLFDFIHGHSSARVFFHSCGAIRTVIPDFIEIGVDILNPVQVSASRMDSRELKAEFGRELTFWGGGVDTQRVLGRGSEADVRDEVRRRLDDLMPGGGFVFSAVHNLQPDVPPANIVAMLETLREHGVYGRTPGQLT